MSELESAYEALPRDDQRFVDEYIRTLNPSASYLHVRPTHTKKTSYVESHKILKKPNVKQAVAERVAQRNVRVEVDQDMVLREVMNAAMLDPIDLFDDRGNLKDLSLIPSYVRRCITAIEVEAIYEGKGDDRKLTGYNKQVKLVSKEKMIELLGRHTGLFPTRHELGGIGGGPIKVDTTVTEILQLMGPEELKLLRAMKQSLDTKAREQLAEGKPHLQLAHSAGGNGNGA